MLEIKEGYLYVTFRLNKKLYGKKIKVKNIRKIDIQKLLKYATDTIKENE